MSWGATSSAGRAKKDCGSAGMVLVAMGVAWADGWRLLGGGGDLRESHTAAPRLSSRIQVITYKQSSWARK